MGNSLTTQSLVPSKLIHCFDQEGNLDPDLLLLFKANEGRVLGDALDEEILECLLMAEEELREEMTNETAGMTNETAGNHRSRRECKKRFIYTRDASGARVPMTAETCLWMAMYIECPDLENPKFHKVFRRRFRMPYDSFLGLLDRVKNDELFKRWSQYDATGKMASPISLLLLGCFRYIGRGWTFDDLDESTCIHEETHRQFFHVFIHWASTRLYDDMVTYPRVWADAKKHMSEFAMAGLHGSVGSTDATHIGMEKCHYRLKNHHSGGKLSMPSRTYNLTCNHRRRILSSTRGHPGRWNDKTLVLFDEFVMGIHKGEILQDVEFELLERNQSGEIVSVLYKGVWLIVDNGYLRWPISICPYKQTEMYKEIRFSEWLESMRKDVECTFGILKGRFRVLKTGIRIHGIQATDKIWLTCCALHNMLLDIDGLDREWEKGIATDWEGELGEHNSGDVSNFAVCRLRSPQERRRYDSTGMGPGNDRDGDDDDGGDPGDPGELPVPMTAGPGPLIVRRLPFEYFRGRLVEHFDILYNQRKIQWPSRLGTTTNQLN
jgi:hypothetical protein